MDKAYVWRAALIAALMNVVLNPGVAWIESRGVDFLPVVNLLGYIAVATVLLCVLVSTLGAHRLHHELRSGHRTPHGGSAEEKELLAGLPSAPWAFGLTLGMLVAAMACLVVAALGLLGFHGMTFGTFVVVVAVYTGGLAFLTMRWTIVRQLMEAEVRVG